MEKNTIKAVVFDIGGVMSSEDNLVWHYPPLCKALNINEKEFLKARDKHMGKAKLGKISGRKMVALFSKDLNVKYKALLENWFKYKRLSVKKNFELERVIKKLKGQGYKVASLSNVIDIHYEVCKEKGIYEPFDFNFSSYKLGVGKPDPRIYKLLLKKLKLPAKEVVFIDDYDSCLKPARKLGIKTILFKNNRQVIRDLKKLGVKA